MKVTKRGINSLIDYSKLRGNKDLAERLPSEEAVYVHEKSRRQYNNKRGIEQEQKAENKSSESQTECRRRLTPLFHFKSHCLFCSKKVGCDKKQWHLAQTLDIREIILKECQQKIEKIENDTWAIEVKKRILGCIDFVASEAVTITVIVKSDFRSVKICCHRTKMEAEIAMNKYYIISEKHMSG